MRKRFEWKVTLQSDKGEVVERKFKAFWDPNFEGMANEVAVAAAVEAWWESGKQTEFAPIAAALVA